jgi:ribonuclease P protein component
MFQRKYRASKEDIEKTVKNGYNIQGNLLYIKVSREKKEKTTFAIIISKKIEKTSVGRHLLKRRVSNAIEDYIKEKKQEISKTIVVFPKKLEKIAKFSQFCDDIFEILSKVS